MVDHRVNPTAGTSGFFAIAATPNDGFFECAGLAAARTEGDARYLWSLVEGLAGQPCDPLVLERIPTTILNVSRDEAPDSASLSIEAA